MKHANNSIALRCALAIAVIAAVCCATVATASSPPSAALLSQFEAFKAKYNKVYGTAEEEAYRLRVFEESIALAERSAAMNPHATFGATMFSDLTQEEFRQRYLMDSEILTQELAAHPLKSLSRPSNSSVPLSFDWRERGAVTPVQLQGKCGSCWAFSTIANIESVHKVATGKLIKLAEQQLVSCAISKGPCRGSLPILAMEWIRRHGGDVYTAESWPYVSGEGKVPECDTEGRVVGARLFHYRRIPGGEAAIPSQLIKTGPVSVLLDCNSWYGYNGGVLTECPFKAYNHAVLIVGYNDKAKIPYWIIKNSWGTQFGEKGFIRLVKGKNACGLNLLPTTALFDTE